VHRQLRAQVHLEGLILLLAGWPMLLEVAAVLTAAQELLCAL
jgi:hypothetical protein